MYSIVLMAAATYGPATPGADMPAAPAPVVVGCTGCTGCTGYSCTGYSCTGYSCTGYSCTGCCGGKAGFLGLRSGCHGGLFGAHNSCHGCTGYSCTGYSCTGYSCFGSCYGCTGYSHHGRTGYSCHGCTGCMGYSCGGCVGATYGTYSYPVYIDPTPPMTPPTTPAPMPTPGTEKKDPEKKVGANLKFQLPATATLFVDGQATSGSGSERSFFTPELIPGQKYYYDVRAEITVAGQTITEEKRVIVSAGASVSESFGKLLAAASGTTTVAGK